MSDLAITAATAITGANTASGDLFPVVDVSASTPKGRSITRDELGTAMVATSALTTALAAKLDKAGGTMTGALTLNLGTLSTAGLTHQQTWNSVGTTCRGVEVKITDTNCAANSTPFRLLTGASGTTQVVAFDKAGKFTFLDTSGHFIDLQTSVGSGVGIAGEYSSGGVRSGFAFNCGDGFAPMMHAVSGGTTALFGAGGPFGTPTGTAPNLMALIQSNTAGTATFSATDKDYNGAYTGVGHSCVFRGGRGTTQGTGAAGGSASLLGGDARGSGNNNGGDVVISGGAPTGTGTRGRVSITNLPTSSAGLSTGMLWNDAGTLKIA